MLGEDMGAYKGTYFGLPLSHIHGPLFTKGLVNHKGHTLSNLVSIIPKFIIISKGLTITHAG